MTSGKHINWLNFGAFFGSCMFICGYGYDEILAHFKKRKTPEGWVSAFKSTNDMWVNDCWAFASKRIANDKIFFFLVLKHPFDFKDNSHAKLAHEIVHLATYNLKDFLDPVQENECFAYTHTHLMTQVYKILRS